MFNVSMHHYFTLKVHIELIVVPCSCLSHDYCHSWKENGFYSASCLLR